VRIVFPEAVASPILTEYVAFWPVPTPVKYKRI